MPLKFWSDFPNTRYVWCAGVHHQCEFRRNRSTTDQISRIRQILEKKWACNETVHQLFADFKKVYDTMRSKVLYDILAEFAKPIKLVR
jgi:hypothetical protein